jgi:S-adenosylmethionine:tRNA ribosyltransferase-isomerase
MFELMNFELPSELIAQEPASPRDHARLLVYDRARKKITDDNFYNLLNYLPDPTLMVVNNSKVEHCRMLFNGGKREIFILEKANDTTVRALVRPGKLFRVGKTVRVTDSVSATTTAIDADGIRTIVFSETLDHPDLVRAQHVPLPPYIAQNDELAAEYQTIYAKDAGSKAAPTAGLHFTSELKQKVQAERDWAELTLHVGLGTFASLTDENFKSGRLHHESYEVSEPVFQHIAQAQHVTAVGTTSVRTLETIFKNGTTEKPHLSGSTDIFIQPGYEFQRVNALITNFHLPGTSLLLLVAAFLGSEAELMTIYNHAIAQNYRFYSFGDCMLIV